MEEKLYGTRKAEALIGIQGTCPQSIRVAFSRSVKRLNLKHVKEEKTSHGGRPEKFWTKEQVIAIYEDYWTRCKNPSAKKPLVFEDSRLSDFPATTADDSGKKIMPATPAAGQKADEINRADCTKNGGMTQQLGNLPAEILALPRWLPTRDDNQKRPVGEKWQLPENQKPFADVKGVKGFVASTETQGGLLFVDFDHCIKPDTGEFIKPCAADWFNRIQQGKYFAEQSTSGTGCHIWGLPTTGKFPKTNGKIYLTEDKKAFIEVFYGTNKFCLPTGKLFRCEQGAPMATGEEADKILEELRAALVDQTANEKSKQERRIPSSPLAPLSDTAEYNQWRAVRMLEVIPPSELDYDDWFAVFTACKTEGLSYSTVDSWSRRDTSVNGKGKPRYNERENLAKWNEPVNPNFNIETLHGIAKRFGYEERNSVREWHDMRGDRKNFKRPTPPMNDSDDFIWTQDRIKSCPINLRLPDDYIFGVDGIEYVMHGKRSDKYISATLTPIVPTKVFHNPINNDVEYEFSLFVFGEWRKVEIPGTALGDREFTRILNGKGANIDNAPYLNKFINAILKRNADILPRPKSYNQTGWTSEEFNEFAFPVNGNSVVRREGYDYERILKPRGDREAWKEKFSEVTTQGGAAAKTVIGFSCAAFLVRPLGLPNLQLHLHGRKSAGKTILEQFACSPFGDPTIHGLSYSFASTPKSRLEMHTAFRDFPMICEELESISKKEIEKIPQDVYQFFMGTSGQALKRDGTRRESKIFSGARLTSGEHSLVQNFGNAGEFKRVLELRYNLLLDEDFSADLYGFCAKNHGLFLEDWTKYISEHQERISKDYHQLLKIVCAEQRDNGKEKDRTQLATLVVSTVAYQHFKICIGLQQSFNCDEFGETVWSVARGMQSAEEIDDTTRAAEFLQSFVAANEKSFVHNVKNPNTNRTEDIVQYTAECYGKIFPDGRVAFFPHTLKKILEEHGGFVSAKKLIGEFAAAGKIEVSVIKGDPLGYAKICGSTKRVYVFKSGTIRDAEEQDDETGKAACL